eukprot:m.459237 g.459237  ORF g.459237 m.459237 type:complete len:243 (-) comp20339_c5_seq3:78-806(-)
MGDKRTRNEQDAATAGTTKRSRAEEDRGTVISITDEDPGLPVSALCIPSHYANDLERIIIPHGVVIDRIEKLAQIIKEDFGEEPLLCLCVLKGGHQFFADLFECIKRMNATTPTPVPLSMDFIRCKSYENQESTGEVRIIGGDNLNELEGRNILIVEDMIDTGTTMVKLLKTLEKYKTKTLKVASLFVKRTVRSNGYRPDYTGFEVPDKFLVGYALDYNEHFRDLQHICVLNDAGKKRYAVE